MSDDKHTNRLEWIDQGVRATVMLAFTFGAIYGFIISKVLSTETFVMLCLVVLQWWFQKQDEKRASNGKNGDSTQAPANSPPPGTQVTTAGTA